MASSILVKRSVFSVWREVGSGGCTNGVNTTLLLGNVVKILPGSKGTISRERYNTIIYNRVLQGSYHCTRPLFLVLVVFAAASNFAGNARTSLVLTSPSDLLFIAYNLFAVLAERVCGAWQQWLLVKRRKRSGRNQTTPNFQGGT